MKRSGLWHGQRISRRVITVGGTLLGLVLALVAIADLASPDPRVVLVETLPIRSVAPPFSYENDLRRFMRVVVMSICPADLEPPVAVGSACAATTDGVRVELRDGLVAGEDGTAVDAADLKEGIERHLRQYEVVIADGNTLSITWKKEEPGHPTVPASLLAQLLRAEPAALVAGEEQLAPVGTGPFYVDELWCRQQRENVQCSRTGGSPPVPLGDLDDWLEDVLVLRRRDWSWMATTEIVVVGLRGEEHGRIDSSSLEPRNQALARALETGDVHAVFDIEADLEAALEMAGGGHPEGWRFSEPRQDRVLVAALHPARSESVEHHLPSGCRPRLVHALAKIRQDPTFLRELGARPADQLLPVPFGPVHTWHVPSAMAGVESSKDCAIELVTNAAWKFAADAIVERLHSLEPRLKVKVSALAPAEEGKRRTERDYGVSLLAIVYRPRPDAFYLWDNLDSSGWAIDEHVEDAADLATSEAKGERPKAEIYAAVDELHRELDAYLIPMGAPTRVVAASDRLLGLDPGRWYLDPDDLRVAPSPLQFLYRSLLLVVSVVLLALAVTTHVSHTTFARRRRVEMSLRMLRHDLLAPLATIRAYAERVREPKIREALLSEAEAALAVAEDARFVLREGKPQAHGSASIRLRDEVVKPILDNLRRRSAYETGKEPTITLDLGDEPPPVSVPPEVAKFVVRNLVENAWMHRGDRPLVLELAGTVAGGFFLVEVKDHGPGITPDEAARLFRPGPDTADRDVLRGSGTGLRLARSVLRLHGGDIELLRPANPTIFTIRFPLASKGRGKPGESPETETP